MSMNPPDKIFISITQEDIDAYPDRKVTLRTCPGALAAQRALPGSWTVGFTTFTYESGETFQASTEVANWILAFCEGEPVEPIEFTIKRLRICSRRHLTAKRQHENRIR